MVIQDQIGVIVSSIMIVSQLSLIAGDNFFFRWSTRVVIGFSVMHALIWGLYWSNRYAIEPIMKGELIWIIPLILGLMSLFVIWRRYAWVASFPIAIMIGVGTGLSMRALITTEILSNIAAVMKESALILVGPPVTQLGYLIRVIFTITGVIYLLFTVGHRGPLSKPIAILREVGKYAFLSYLGLSVGNAIMQHSGLATSAISRLLKQWLGL